MKTKFFKYSVLIIAAMAWGVTVNAQDSNSDKYSNYDSQSKDAHGNTIERVHTFTDGKEYSFKLVNGKVANLYVDDVKIAPEQYAKYSTEINKIKEQIRLDRIQAEKDRAQAKIDRAQADKDRAQAEKDRGQAEKDRMGAVSSRGQAEKDRAQAGRDRLQAEKDRAQGDKDREQAVRDRAQAELDRAQAVKDRAQAEIDRKQAEEDRKLMAQMINDLINDKIITDEQSLHEVTLNADEMTVNGKKQSDEVFKKYKTRYNRFANYNFSYGNNPGGSQYRGIHMSKARQ
jgi:colicin import membrane protein